MDSPDMLALDIIRKLPGKKQEHYVRQAKQEVFSQTHHCKSHQLSFQAVIILDPGKY
jgi:hypothetical protein